MPRSARALPAIAEIVSARWLRIAHVLLLAAFLLVQFAPTRDTYFVRSDSGTFLYVGQQIDAGQIPYRDAWDHKPPLIFYLNALGLLIAMGSPWGVWVLAFAFSAFALWFMYDLCIHCFGPMAATVAVTCMAGAMVWPLEYANVTEVYAVLFQVLAAYAIVRLKGLNAGLLLGAATCALFLLRANLVGMGGAALAIVLITGSWSTRSFWRMLMGIAAGFLLPLVIVVAYFSYWHSFRDMLNASLLFNMEYSDTTWSSRIASLLPGVRFMSSTGTLILAALGFAVALLSRFRNLSTPARAAAMMGAIALPIEFAFSSLSGRGYLHYFLPWAVPVAILCGYLAYVITQQEFFQRRAAIALGTGLVLLHGALGYAVLKKFVNREADEKRETLARYVSSHTKSNEHIYVWGYGPEIYIMSHRTAPGRYFIHTPLQLHRFADQPMISEMMASLNAAPPRMIIDSSGALGTHFPPLDSQRRGETDGNLSAAMNPFFSWIENRYKKVDVPGIGSWAVYELAN